MHLRVTHFACCKLRCQNGVLHNPLCSLLHRTTLSFHANKMDAKHQQKSSAAEAELARTSACPRHWSASSSVHTLSFPAGGQRHARTRTRTRAKIVRGAPCCFACSIVHIAKDATALLRLVVHPAPDARENTWFARARLDAHVQLEVIVWICCARFTWLYACRLFSLQLGVTVLRMHEPGWRLGTMDQTKAKRQSAAFAKAEPCVAAV